MGQLVTGWIFSNLTVSMKISVDTNSQIAIGLLIVLLIVYLVTNQYVKNHSMEEGFSIQETLYSPELYDRFFSKLYDQMFYLPAKNNLEVTELETHTITNPDKVRLLDVGCGTGQHIRTLSDQYQTIGLDISKDMIRQARKNNPDSHFIQGDVRQENLFEPKTFTHITCYYFTFYYFPEPSKIFHNFYRWLRPGGYVALHLVNPDKFDPIVDAASPFPAFSLQKYTHRRITRSKVHFNNFVYSAHFKPLSDHRYMFIERFKFKKNGKMRKHIHRLYMLPVKQYISIAKSEGFIYRGKTDLLTASCEYQYVLYFRKPLQITKTADK